MIEFRSYRTGIQGTPLAISRVEGSSYKPFGLEAADLELETERLKAERFTPMQGVHKCIHRSFSLQAPQNSGDASVMHL